MVGAAEMSPADAAAAAVAVSEMGFLWPLLVSLRRDCLSKRSASPASGSSCSGELGRTLDWDCWPSRLRDLRMEMLPVTSLCSGEAMGLGASASQGRPAWHRLSRGTLCSRHSPAAGPRKEGCGHLRVRGCSGSSGRS